MGGWDGVGGGGLPTRTCARSRLSLLLVWLHILHTLHCTQAGRKSDEKTRPLRRIAAPRLKGTHVRVPPAASQRAHTAGTKRTVYKTVDLRSRLLLSMLMTHSRARSARVMGAPCDPTPHEVRSSHTRDAPSSSALSKCSTADGDGSHPVRAPHLGFRQGPLLGAALGGRRRLGVAAGLPTSRSGTIAGAATTTATTSCPRARARTSARSAADLHPKRKRDVLATNLWKGETGTHSRDAVGLEDPATEPKGNGREVPSGGVGVVAGVDTEGHLHLHKDGVHGVGFLVNLPLPTKSQHVLHQLSQLCGRRVEAG